MQKMDAEPDYSCVVTAHLAADKCCATGHGDHFPMVAVAGQLPIKPASFFNEVYSYREEQSVLSIAYLADDDDSSDLIARQLVDDIIGVAMVDVLFGVSAIPRSLGLCDLHQLPDNSAGDGDSKRNEQPEIVTKLIEYASDEDKDDCMKCELESSTDALGGLLQADMVQNSIKTDDRHPKKIKMSVWSRFKRLLSSGIRMRSAI